MAQAVDDHLIVVTYLAQSVSNEKQDLSKRISVSEQKNLLTN